ncbi:hypothetical protein [Hymenobacter cheonanensis]|uniref:hypothetical protein n=1 Tax=Hymenobacter sp. CA2-7 TaxID=3063993 RepID=UPI002712357E|nr:hypothetical protein [Hymenobacter sp. CA2-7]MDO7884765.1 hypothetical protein [Hymenobacter sp. CA2-7]
MLEVQGKFHAIDSFAIRARKEFYIIGQLVEGKVEPNWFAGIQLNPSLALTVRIKQIDTVEMFGEQASYLLLVVEDDDFLLLGLNVGSELINITVEGEE